MTIQVLACVVEDQQVQEGRCKENGAAKEDLWARVSRVVVRIVTLVESGGMRPSYQHNSQITESRIRHFRYSRHFHMKGRSCG